MQVCYTQQYRILLLHSPWHLAVLNLTHMVCIIGCKMLYCSEFWNLICGFAEDGGVSPKHVGATKYGVMHLLLLYKKSCLENLLYSWWILLLCGWYIAFFLIYFLTDCDMQFRFSHTLSVNKYLFIFCLVGWSGMIAQVVYRAGRVFRNIWTVAALC
jgi:hypothetical protein